MSYAEDKRDPGTTPIENAIANLQDRVDRVAAAANLLDGQLASVLQPAAEALAASPSVTEAQRPNSPLLNQLQSIDGRLFAITDQLNDLRDRLDI
jgi:hypothetical protein